MLRRSSLHCITLSACSIHQNVQFCIFRYQLMCSLCILLPAISSLWGEERYVILYVPVFRGFPYPASLQCTENCSVGILAVCQVVAVRFIAVIKDVAVQCCVYNIAVDRDAVSVTMLAVIPMHSSTVLAVILCLHVFRGFLYSASC